MILSFLSSFFVTALSAQATQMKCGDDAVVYELSRDMPKCYAADEYSQYSAEEAFKQEVRDAYSCDDSDCDTNKTCDLNFQIRNARKVNGQWCFEYSFDIKCTKCRRKRAGDVQVANLTLDTSDGLISNVSPNPVTGMVNIDLDMGEKKEVNIQVLNLQGQVLKSKFIQNIEQATFTTNMDLGDLPKGLYVINASTDGASIGYSKILVQ